MSNVEILARIKKLLEELKANLGVEENILEARKKKLNEAIRTLDSILGKQSFSVASELLPSKTTYENIAYALEVVGASDQEVSRDVPKVLEIVGLTEKANNFPQELSGGERQRAAIARALIHRPEVILADEPTGNLDPYHSLDIIQLLLKIQEMGTTVILATHNKEVINSLGKRVITLEGGRVIRDEEKGRFIL